MVQNLDFEDVLEIHAEIMQRLGSAPQAIVREGDLRSALSRPQWAAHYDRADLVAQAARLATARLATGIARAHGFVDGNKRTAYACLVVFLALNELRLTGDSLDIGPLLVRLAGPDIDDLEADRELEHFLRQRVTLR